jgi:hypothetical protein
MRTGVVFSHDRKGNVAFSKSDDNEVQDLCTKIAITLSFRYTLFRELIIEVSNQANGGITVASNRSFFPRKRRTANKKDPADYIRQ